MHEGKEAVGGMGREVSDGIGCSSAAALVVEAAEIVGRHQSCSHLFSQHCVLTTAKVRRNVGALRRCLSRKVEKVWRGVEPLLGILDSTVRATAELQQSRSISPSQCGNHP